MRAVATSLHSAPILGHSRIDTTQLYTDEIELDEHAEALARAYAARNAQASPDWTTLETDFTAELLELEMEAAGIEPASADAPTERLQA